MPERRLATASAASWWRARRRRCHEATEWLTASHRLTNPPRRSSRPVADRHLSATGRPMTARALMRHPTGYLPVAMSVGALAMIIWYVALHGVARQADEGLQAHVWQLL